MPTTPTPKATAVPNLPVPAVPPLPPAVPSLAVKSAPAPASAGSVKSERLVFEEFTPRHGSQDPHDMFACTEEGQATNSEYLAETVMPTLSLALEALLKAMEADPDIKPIPWLATHLQHHNIPSVTKRENEAIAGALAMVTPEQPREELFWNAVKALRSVLWPCSAYIATIGTVSEQVEIPPSPEALLAYERQQQAAAIAKAEAEAAAKAARPKTPKGAKKGKDAPPPEPEPVEEPPPPPPKWYKTVVTPALIYEATSHIDPTTIEGKTLKKGVGVTWASVVAKLTVLIKDVMQQPNVHFFGDRRPGSYAVVPLFCQRKVIGVLTVDTLIDSRQLKEKDLVLIERVAEIVSGHLDRIALMPPPEEPAEPTEGDEQGDGEHPEGGEEGGEADGEAAEAAPAS